MKTKNDNYIFISVVVPIYNEELVLDEFYNRLIKTIDDINKTYEIIFINDGSTDQSLKKLIELNSKNNRVKLIDLSRNFGKEIAVTAGLDFVAGEVIVVIDADLQDPPEIIPLMIDKWQKGADTVYATRTKRDGETILKKTTASIFYRTIKRLTKIKIPKNTGDYRLMSKRTVEALGLLREQNRFMKGLFSWVGFKQVSISYQREPRYAGETKWNFWKLWNFAIEGITSFSYVPLQIAIYLGCSVSILSFVYALYLIVRVVIYGKDVEGYASIMVSVLFFSGVQLLFLGVIGEYLGRISNESKNRPLYIIQNLLGIEGKNNKYIFKDKRMNIE